MKKVMWVLVLALVLAGCGAQAEESTFSSFVVGQSKPQSDLEDTGADLIAEAKGEQMPRTIVLGAGCFWGVEAYYKLVPGVLEVESGYANGKSEDTSYPEIAQTGHAEVVKLTYDANKIHLAEILERFYVIVDPLALNRQGNDVGTQYRSGIYYETEEAEEIVERSLDLFHERLGSTSYIEVETLVNYVPAEDYHQNYLEKHPSAYCHVNLSDAKKILYPGEEKPSDEDLQANLDALTYEVTQNKGTERAYSSPLDQEDGVGIYVDAVTGQPLFSSLDKYDSGCGWPSFTKPITTDILQYTEDSSHGMQRVEVLTRGVDNHLGHVFADGPAAEGGLRYCMNGVSLRFVPETDMLSEGYSALLPYLIEE